MPPPVLRRSVVLAGLLSLAFAGAAAAAEVRVMSSGGFTAAYRALIAEFERQSGHTLVSSYGASMGDAADAIPQRLGVPHGQIDAGTHVGFRGRPARVLRVAAADAPEAGAHDDAAAAVDMPRVYPPIEGKQPSVAISPSLNESVAGFTAGTLEHIADNLILAIRAAGKVLVLDATLARHTSSD